MEDFEIDIISEEKGSDSSVQLPMNFVSIGEIENDDVKVYIKEDVCKKLEEYSSSDLKHELGTILLGNYTEELGKMNIVISDFIYAKYTDASASTLTFTHETWDYISKEYESKYSDLKIIGWQHTHPGYGIFLSNYDMFIQENFFNLPFQTAYVIDPVQHIRGFFQWKNGKVEKLKGFFIYNDVGKKISTKLSPKEKRGKADNVILEKKSVSTLEKGILLFCVILLLNQLFLLLNNKRLKSQNDNQEQLITEQEHKISLLEKTSSEENDSDKELKADAVQDNDNSPKNVLTDEQEIEEIKADNNNIIIFYEYKVQEGDTLESICINNDIDLQSYRRIICSVNNLENENKIYSGQEILLPIREKK